jgi:hypothetical protein
MRTGCAAGVRGGRTGSRLKRVFHALVGRGGAAEAITHWGLVEIERLFALWHRFQDGELELQRRLAPLKARMRRLLWRGEDSPDHEAVGLCREPNKCWDALWAFTQDVQENL